MSLPVRTLVLISGFARAGKDTIGDGIISGCFFSKAVKINFADSLKDSCNNFLQSLNLGGSKSPEVNFLQDKFKCKNREFLVQCGRFARSIDVDVFAYAMLDECYICSQTDKNSDLTFVCTDWRYKNEYDVCKKFCKENGWSLVTVYVQTQNVVASNDEEARSVGQLIRELSFDHIRNFKQDQKGLLGSEGFDIAKSRQL